MKLKKKLYIAVSIIFVLLIVFTVIITHERWLEEIAKFLIVEDKLSNADVIVILGGGSEKRVQHAVTLYRSGYGARIIATGMKVKLPGIKATWSQLALKELVSLRVPENAIILEERPTSTYEDAKYVKEDMLDRNFKSAIIVSSPYHMRRARMIFRKVFSDRDDISLMFSPIENSNYQIHKWWTREEELINTFNEYCKLFFYFFKYII